MHKNNELNKTKELKIELEQREVYKTSKKDNKRLELTRKSLRSNGIRKMAYISIFSGISVLLYLFLKFPLPFFPSWLEINFSMLPVFLIMYLIGYKEALVVVLIRFLFKLGFTSTAYVGETADLLIGLVTVFAGGLYFNHSKKTNKNIIISMVIAVAAWIVVGSITNTFILIPWYLTAYGWKLSDLANMLKPLYSDINSENFMFYYNIFGVIPFNLLLGSIVSIITFIVAKRLDITNQKNI